MTEEPVRPVEISEYDQMTLNYLRGVGVPDGLVERVERLAVEDDYSFDNAMAWKPVPDEGPHQAWEQWANEEGVSDHFPVAAYDALGGFAQDGSYCVCGRPAGHGPIARATDDDW